jgi:DnaJ-class molecular chaperone
MSSKLIRCEVCKGTGKIVTYQFHLASARKCEQCNGVGRVRPSRANQGAKQ